MAGNPLKIYKRKLAVFLVQVISGGLALIFMGRQAIFRQYRAPVLIARA
jgi:hypothetical protein